ncbi:MAG: hypothetical protein ABJC89_20960 [Acidobacteriota bacterium]
MMTTFSMTLVVLTAFGLPLQTQGPPTHGNDRAAMVMGFDQERTAHHFYLYDDGGAIDVSAKDAGNSQDRDAIRSHLPHITMMFGQGDFDAPMLVHDSKAVPGTATLARLKDQVAYTYVETPTGGRVNIVTRDTAALAALHAFLVYQIREHQTGDLASVRRRQ